MVVNTRAPEIVAGNVIPFAIACVFVIARFISRLWILRIFLLEDWLLLLSWIAAIANCGLVIAAAHFGSGQHEVDVSIDHIATFLKIQYADVLFYQTSLSLTKISLCVMYLRLFGVDRFNRCFLWSVIVGLVTSTIALIIFNIFRCHPISHSWNLFESGTCVTQVPSFWVSLGFALVADILILGFSTWQVSRLKMSRRDKICMHATLGIGWIVVIAAIVRAIRIDAVIKDGTDATYRAYDTSIWGTVEINVALLCTSAVASKPFLKKLLPRLMSTTTGTVTTLDRHQWRSLTAPPDSSQTTTTIELSKPNVEASRPNNHIVKDTQLIILHEDV